MRLMKKLMFGYCLRLQFIAIFIAIIVMFTNGQTYAQQTMQAMPGNPVAKDFKLKNLDGEFVSLSDFKGQVVMINFWATWCPPCRKEMPSMQRAWEQYQKNDIMMLAVHIGGDVDEIWSFVSEYNLDFPVLIDGNSKVSNAWPILGIPTSFVIDKQGKIAYRAIGGREWDSPQLMQMMLSLNKK